MASSSRSQSQVPPPPDFDVARERRRRLPDPESCVIYYLHDFDGKPRPYLWIPPGYNLYISESPGDYITLEGLSGLDWIVKLESFRGRLHLTEGWPAFVRDNGVQNRDRLCMRRLGNGRYKMEVYNNEHVYRIEAKTAVQI